MCFCSPHRSDGFASPVAFAQDWMPDANLRVAVREDLGLAADAELTQAKMADLINLHESKAGITNITGIEHATNLQTFVLWGKQFQRSESLDELDGLDRDKDRRLWKYFGCLAA